MTCKLQLAKGLIEPKFRPIGEQGGIVPRRADPKDVEKIVEIVNAESERSGALLKVTEAQVGEWVRNGLSFVAVDESTGRISAHMAVKEWPKCHEIRSVVVHPEYQGMGIYATMTMAIVESIFSSNVDTSIVEIKNEKSQGLGFLARLGFTDVPLSRATELGLVLQNEFGRHAHLLTYGGYQMMMGITEALRE